jgi:sugar/nucleoside kinase (ribokinase family)
MGILVVGSVALDSVRTPSGYAEEILGGSAVFFSIAASYFTDVSVVAVVGDDFPERHVAFLQGKGIDTSGLHRQAGRTFRWKGEYSGDLNAAKTLDTQLNVFGEFNPRLTAEQRQSEYLFLGNIDPDLQQGVLEQMQKPRVVACDTMNYWIDSKRQSLQKVLALADIVLVNDAEARHLAGEQNLFRAARKILSWGPRHIVVKRGEYGAVLVGPRMVFEAPAYPLEDVIDPTGAGDSFAGGFMGYLAAKGSADDAELRQALVFGSVMASFNVTDFGTKRLGTLTFPEVEGRFREFKRLTEFQDV